MTLHVTVPGKPQPKVTKQVKAGGHARVKPTGPTKTWMGILTTLAMEEVEDRPLFSEGPVRLTVFAFFACPKGDMRKTMEVPLRPHTKRGDLTNVVKAVEDALTGVAWTDDSQVAWVDAQKFYCDQNDNRARTEIYVEQAWTAPEPPF